MPVRQKRKHCELSVVDITKGTDLKHPPTEFPDVLPQHEFSMLLVAPRGSGKTNLICNLILRQYFGYFNNILVCSPTFENDEKWDKVKATPGILQENKKLKTIRPDWAQGLKPQVRGKPEEFDGKIPEDNFFTELDHVMPIMKKQEALIKELHTEMGPEAKFVADRVLLIIDDQAGNFQASGYKNPIANFVMRHRHYNASVIVVTQAFKAMTSAIRTNCSCQILFEISNKAELRKFYEEFPSGLDEEDWMEAYRYCIEKPYGFMYLNSVFPKGRRVFSNFEEFLVNK